LDALSGTIPVDHVFFAAGLPEAKADDEPLQTATSLLGGREPEELAWGDVLALGRSIELVMLWPDQRVADGDNDESVCLGLDYDADNDGNAEIRMLLTGDAESPQLTALLAKAQNASSAPAATHFDILKVGHHGSSGAVTVAQLEQMGCRVAFISVGKNNRYGHPTPETLLVLDQADVTVYRTDLNGDVTLHFEREEFVVHCGTMAVETS
jgi:competence protein ComEC